MSTIRKDAVNAAISRTYSLVDTNICNDIHKQYEFRKQTVLTNESLTKDEKTEAIKILSRTYDRNKFNFNEGTKRICENCNQECLATTYVRFVFEIISKQNFQIGHLEMIILII